MRQHDTRKSSVNWNGPLRAVLLLALTIPLFASAPVPAPISEAGNHAHPALLKLAADCPGSRIEVIVQKSTKEAGLEQMVTQLGGRVTKNLHIINAFAAELPAKAVEKLSKEEGVRWVSLDAPVVKSVGEIDTSRLVKPYPKTIKADRLWNAAPYLRGQGVTIAVVDSGINGGGDDFRLDPDVRHSPSRMIAAQKFNSNTSTASDGYGHGTHIAGIIGGNGAMLNGSYIGVAPMANLVNIKVSDDRGQSSASDVVAGLQWINDNKARHNIKIVNLSLNSSVPESYHTSPLSAAVEILWFNGMVVVVSAGNNGTANLYPPANDPFVITVGATDDRDTHVLADDILASFSAYGLDETGGTKPDLVAPGTNIVSVLANRNAELYQGHRNNLVGESYFRMSGTSVAAPMVAGAAALLLQDEPNLTPDQVKYRLKATAQTNWQGYDALRAGAGILNVQAAVQGSTTQSANTGIVASRLLWAGGLLTTWGSVNWNSVNWNSVNWNSVNWNSVNWNSVNWNSDYWDY